MSPRNVPLPDRLAKLDRDHRGFPIPFLVLRDPGTGKANFTINDERKRARCLHDDLCPICGQKLTRGRWFIGGPGSAFAPNGAYLDPPAHFECSRFALQVCPYLAIRKYTGRIDDGLFDWSAHQEETFVLADETMIPGRPLVFVAVMATGQKLVGPPYAPYVTPRRPYSRVEFWRDGVEIGEAEVAPLLEASLADLAQAAKDGRLKAKPPRIITRPEAAP